MDISAPGFAAEARAKAEAWYAQKAFYCSEAVLRAILELTGRDPALTALASGFAAGMGGAGCACGAEVGGVIALGLFFGRTEPGDPRVDACMRMAKELHDGFRDRHKALCCRILNKGVVHGSPEQRALCVKRTGDAAELTARILAREWQNRC